MKKILIIEDDQIVANVYRNKLAVEGYQTEAALDGESGLKMMRTFQPDAIVLDLMLPKMSGVEVIREIRGEAEFSKVPIIVFSNTYLTNMVQEAWKAGATKCISKINCSPKEFLDLVRHTVGGSGAFPQAQRKTGGAPMTKPLRFRRGKDAAFQADLRKTFIEACRPRSPPCAPAGKTSSSPTPKRRGSNISTNSTVVSTPSTATPASSASSRSRTWPPRSKRCSRSFTKIRKASTPQHCAPSPPRWIFSFLFERGTRPEKQEMPAVNVLVVDDQAISCRSIVYALEKAQLRSVSVEDPNAAFKLLSENHYDLVFLDVDMPGMTGFELCAKLRSLPAHQKTPVVFVTVLSDFENRTSSRMAGGDDFIAKPFLHIELAVKALIHVLRGKLQPAK